LCVMEADQQTNVSINRLAGIETNWAPGDWLFHAYIDDIEVRVGTERIGNTWRLSQGGSVREFTVVDPHVADLMRYMPVKEERDMSKFLLSPMPGLLMKVLVNEGDSVTAGQDLAVVAAAGDSLAVDDVIIEFES